MKANIKNFKSCLKPSPNIIVSCRGLNGENNALAVAYACNCSFNPPMVMVGIVPERYSYHMVKENKCYVVNLVSTGMKEEFNYLGSHSGRDEDKFKKLSLKYTDGIKVNAPILLDFPVNIECKVVDSITTGSHEMFVGKIEHIHADNELVTEDGNIDFSKIDLL